MKVGITGASGFVGRALAAAVAARGWQAAPLARRPEPGDLEGLDAVVHLAGESIDGRWTAEKKAEIMRSRADGTRDLVLALAKCERRPRVLVSASAVGFYGDRDDEPLYETTVPGAGFLADVCLRWESKARAAEALGMRVAMLRTGIVLGRGGGALVKMATPFKFGAGGPLGNGRQFVPWIALDDLVAMYLFAIENEAVSGPINAVTPDYATSARFAQALGAAMRRPALAPAPAPALRAVPGEFADTVLASQLVIPRKAQAAGFVWRHPRLEIVMQAIFDPSRPSRLLRTFDARQFVPAPIESVFAFFSDARNLEAITPPSLHFGFAGPVPPVGEGTVIDYRLRLHGFPLRWKTLIARWEAPTRFVDVQLRGPYALWEHCHEFIAERGGTTLLDRVTYALPVQPLGDIADGFVRGDVEEIFRYRAEVVDRYFAARSEGNARLSV